MVNAHRPAWNPIRITYRIEDVLSYRTSKIKCRTMSYGTGVMPIPTDQHTVDGRTEERHSTDTLIPDCHRHSLQFRVLRVNYQRPRVDHLQSWLRSRYKPVPRPEVLRGFWLHRARGLGVTRSGSREMSIPTTCWSSIFAYPLLTCTIVRLSDNHVNDVIRHPGERRGEAGHHIDNYRHTVLRSDITRGTRVPKARAGGMMIRRPHRARAIGIAALLVAPLALAACSSGATSSDNPSSSATSGGQSNAKPVNKVLGVVPLLATDPLNIEAINGAKSVAKKNGWQVKVVDTQANPAQANAAMQTYASQKVGGIYVLAYATSAIGAGMNAARSAGIPVASWGGDPADDIVSTVDNAAVGEAAAKALISDVPAPADVLILTFHGGALCLSDQAQFDKYVNAKTGYKVTKEEVVSPGQVQSGQSFTTAWLASHPKNGHHYAILSCWDDPMQGAIAALKQSGRNDVKTFSVNGEAPNIKLVKSGWQTATVAPAAYQQGVQAMKDIIAATKQGSSFTPNVMDFAPTVVTKENVATFEKSQQSQAQAGE